MDGEQEELQFLGLFSILKESFKILYKWKKIFTQISLTLVLPLAFIFLAHLEIAHVISHSIWHTRFQQEFTPPASARYKRLSHLITKETVLLWSFRAVYFFFLLTFSLLSVAAVVYTIASICTSKEVTFKKVMKIVPKVWKKLMLTLLCTAFLFTAYNIAAGLIIAALDTIEMPEGLYIASFFTLVIIYAAGFVYLSIIWNLANVVTVLEDSYAFRAMIKSKDLIKGKLWTAVMIFFLLNLVVIGVNFLFKFSVVYRVFWSSLAMIPRVGLGVLCLSLLFGFILFGLVIQTILYFVCKSYHHEIIDKSKLSDHLEVIYLGEYVPLRSSVQLEQVRA